MGHLHRESSNEIEIVCFHTEEERDLEYLEDIRRHCHVWRNIWGQRVEGMASKVNQEAVDILVDLNTWVQGERTELLAARPARTQVCFFNVWRLLQPTLCPRFTTWRIWEA